MKGKIIQSQDIPSFLIEKQPKSVSKIIYDYFCTLCFLNAKGAAIQADIILYYDEELEQKYIKIKNEFDYEEEEVKWTDTNKFPWLTFSFLPQIHEESTKWQERFEKNFTSSHNKEIQNIASHNSKVDKEASCSDIKLYYDNFINNLTALKEVSDKINIS